MTDWSRLVSAAVLGTARRPPPELEDPVLRELLAPAGTPVPNRSGPGDGNAGAGERAVLNRSVPEPGIGAPVPYRSVPEPGREPPVPYRSVPEGEGPEARLLTAAGALALLRQAGRRPAPAPALGPAAPPDPEPICSPAACARLGDLLEGRRSLLAEWLGAVARAGRRPPPERLPDLLEVATVSETTRVVLSGVLGERGRWLAAQEPRWRWAAPIPGDEAAQAEIWRTGDRPARRRLFAGLRASEPARARDLLDASWPQEDPRDRAWFVEALAVGLGPGDEAALERALDDRRQEVRAPASALLAVLPGSAFAARMAARAAAAVRVGPGRIVVTLPEAIDDAMRRDGIAERPPSGMGRRAWLLAQVVAATPLDVWERVGLTPAGAASLDVEDGLGEPLREALARATLAQRDERWAAALVDARPEVAPALALEARVRRAGSRLAAGDADVALGLDAPWPAILTPAALRLLVRRVAANDRAGARALAERIDPAAADEAADRLAEAGRTPGIARLAHDVLTTLAIRRDMHEEIDERRPA